MDSSSDSEYVASDDEAQHFDYASVSDHTAYLSKTVSYALESLQLDKSLVHQAQLSGHINNENQRLVEKSAELQDKIATIARLYAEHFESSTGPSKVARLHKDICDIESRIDKVINGRKKLFSQSQGVAAKFPVEYNQARDKVMERQVDE